MAKKKTKPTPATEAVKAERKIPLQDPERLTVRIVDNKTKVDKARVEELVTAGWQYLDPDDLAVRAADIGFKVMDSHVVCGDHGEEVLLKILTVDLAAFEEAEDTRVRAEDQVDRGLRPANRSLEKSEILAQIPKPAKSDARKAQQAAQRSKAQVHTVQPATRTAKAQAADEAKAVKADAKAKAKAEKAAKGKAA